MPVRERQRIPIARAEPVQRPIGPCAHLIGLLTVWATVSPQAPTRPLLADLRGGEPLVVAVIPFAKVLADRRPVREAGQFARLARPPQRARQHERELPTG